MSELMGKRASAGVYTGKVQWIKHHSLMSELEPGNILATKMTTPDWIEAFDKIKAMGGGIITATGGMTCHAAVVCREYGIPCVVGLVVAHDLHGRTVTMDGATGKVTVHD